LTHLWSLVYQSGNRMQRNVEDTPRRVSIFAARGALAGAAISLAVFSWVGCRTAQPAAAKPAAEAPQQRQPAQPGPEAVPEEATADPNHVQLSPELAAAVDKLVRERLGNEPASGVRLHFDPKGADFTAWVRHMKNEVYRNWIMPQAALQGIRGHVDIELTVERDGRATVRIVKTSGALTLARAAQNAVASSRFLPLPADYEPPRVTMTIGFFYNESPVPNR
jgi:TonB family protein